MVLQSSNFCFVVMITVVVASIVGGVGFTKSTALASLIPCTICSCQYLLRGMMRPRLYPWLPPLSVQSLPYALAYSSLRRSVTFLCVCFPSIFVNVSCGKTNVVAFASVDMVVVFVGVRMLSGNFTALLQ